MNYDIAQGTRIGGREINQDRAAWHATDKSVLMVVADGMGGHLQGEVAAQIAIDTLVERFRAEARPRLANPADFLSAALLLAHRTIVRYAADCRIPAHVAPRTTCIACVVQDGTASWAHAGDSRLYLIHQHSEGPAKVAHTRDHSVVQRMVDEGAISADEAIGHPLRNRVFSCLGGDAAPQIEVTAAIRLQDGDLLALCTDGAWSPLGDTLVAEIGRAPLTSTVPHLLDAAERAAGPGADNLTLIAMRWGESDPDAVGERRAREAAVSDVDLEQAIAQIRRRNPHKPNGASS